jgi:Rap1a immunity proteins
MPFATLILITFLITGLAHAEGDEDVSSANYVMAGCREFVDTLNTSRATRLPLQFGYCSGIVHAIALISLSQPGSMKICLPRSVNRGQLVRVVTKYIDERPERLHEQFVFLAIEALRTAWPCKRKEGG